MKEKKMVGIARGRAAYAFEKVKKFKEQNDGRKDILKDYRSYVKKLPAMIQVNGLGESMAFYYSKKCEKAAKKSAYGQIYDDIARWIESSMSSTLHKYKEEGKNEFVEILINMDSADYRLVTIEVLALLNWMRRFVDGMIVAE